LRCRFVPCQQLLPAEGVGSVATNAKVVWDLVSEQEGQRVSAFKWRHFQGEVILWAVRWYCRYGISYRDLEQMMGERGVSIDHSTIYRWVQRYAPRDGEAAALAVALSAIDELESR
jgi:hypothetical protein